MQALDASLVELPDWNCCGATGAEVLSHLALDRTARAQSGQGAGDGRPDRHNLQLLLLQPIPGQCPPGCRCGTAGRTGCRPGRGRPALRRAGCGCGTCWSLLVTDIGVKAIARRVQRRLGGIRVAPYYGCLVVRPYAEFDGPDLPTSMDRLLTALGASVVPYAMKTRCCGGVLMTTQQEIALKLVGDVLAPVRDVDCVVTVCPLCQLNLEAYQRQVGGTVGRTGACPGALFHPTDGPGVRPAGAGPEAGQPAWCGTEKLLQADGAAERVGVSGESDGSDP